ncbi:MAG: hypothetical protein AB7E72_18195 [Lysobacterales bacterium]
MDDSWWGLAVLVAIPALLVLGLPRARLWLGMVLWVLSPVALLLIMILWELLTRPAPSNTLELAFTGFMYVAVFGGLPWLIVSGSGFALGWWLRGLLRTEPASVVPSRPGTSPGPAALARNAPDPNATLAVQLSPCDSIRVETQASEWANTHWVDSPRVIDTRTGQVLLDLLGSDWDVKVEFPGDRQVLLLMRRYRQPGHMAATLDLDLDRFVIDLAPGAARSGALKALDAAIAEAWRAVCAEAAATTPATPGTARPGRFAAWRSALAILLAALLAIAGLSYWTVTHTPEPRIQLTPLPSGKPH